MARQIEGKNIIGGGLITITMNYNSSECSLIEKRDQKDYRQCIFQIVAVGISEEPWVYSIYT